ncbi:DUF4232 domain-containing protein [Streptomyces sp. Da 82-17]|uniref:DUF4232 domain-containing protein n=1 Tax=Streptomyces sp. Da 82-17 TaxID=3377116 RepID=UPI0038D3A530
MRPHKLTLTALALAAGLALTACEGTQGAAGTGDQADSPASSERSTDPAGDGGSSQENEENEENPKNPEKPGGQEDPKPDDPSGDPGDGNGDTAPTGICKTADLDFRTAPGMAEGNLMVVLKNTGGTCTFKGFPGVDLKTDGSGTISAARSGIPAPSVVVRTGEESRFTLHFPRNDSGGSGVHITGLVVTPPDETHSKTLPVDLTIPATDGSGRPVTVDPVGTGKQ